MSSGPLLLKGRYLAKTVKLGIATGIACAVAGTGTYVLVQKRINDSQDYIKSITADFHETNDDRIMKFAGYKRDKRFPHVPMLNNSEGTYDEFYKKYAGVDIMLKLESEVLQLTDKDDFFWELFLSGIREDWIENKDQKTKYHEQLRQARENFLIKAVKNSKIPKENKTFHLYMYQLGKQVKQNKQDPPMPLAVEFLPKPPSE